MARRFAAQEPTIYRDLQATMRKLGATSLRVPRDFLDIENVEAEIIFDLAGKRYIVRCSKWAEYLDNFRAAERTIFMIHSAINDYGAISAEQLLAGFEALPDDSALLLTNGKRTWWDTLGVKPAATKAEIISAYRALARTHHPDAGGNVDDFKRLRRAYEEGLEAAGGRKA